MSIRRSILFFAVVSGLAACKDEPATSSSQSDAASGEAKSRDDGPSAPAADLPDAQALLSKSVEAAGGKDKISAIDNFYLEGTVTILGQNIVGHSKTWWSDGDFYIEQEMPGVGKVRAGKRGEVIWSEDPIHGLRRLEGIEAEQHRWASSLMLPATWKEYFDSAQTLDAREVEGTTVHDVKLSSDTGGELVLVFSEDTGLQVGQKFSQVSPMGPVPVEVEFSDYREVEGIKVPFKQVTNAGFAKVTQTVDKLEVNAAKVDPKKFEMPSDGADVVDASKKPE